MYARWNASRDVTEYHVLDVGQIGSGNDTHEKPRPCENWTYVNSTIVALTKPGMKLLASVARAVCSIWDGIWQTFRFLKNQAQYIREPRHARQTLLAFRTSPPVDPSLLASTLLSRRDMRDCPRSSVNCGMQSAVFQKTKLTQHAEKAKCCRHSQSQAVTFSSLARLFVFFTPSAHAAPRREPHTANRHL